jgi:predicted alpha/beta hydrolase
VDVGCVSGGDRRIGQVYLDSYAGTRFAESARYVRSYPAALAALRDLLPEIRTPMQIIASKRDQLVPPANAEYLHRHLPNSRLALLDRATSPGRTGPTSGARSRSTGSVADTDSQADDMPFVKVRDLLGR